MKCQRCESERILSGQGKCSDMSSWNFREAEHEGYVPSDLGIGGGNYIEMDVCLECGQLQGTFPRPDPDFFVEQIGEAPHPKYSDGAHVWLPEFHNGQNLEPRQFAAVGPQDSDGRDPDDNMYSANVAFQQNRIERDDDGQRELSEDQIEGAAVYLSDLQCGHSEIGFGPAVSDLDEALAVAQRLFLLYKLYDDMYGGGGYAEWTQLCQGQDLAHSELEFLAVRHLEGADVCVDLDGKTWSLNETEDGWESLEDGEV